MNKDWWFGFVCGACVTMLSVFALGMYLEVGGIK